MFLFAFDLIELNGQDLRREPIEIRKRELGKLLRLSAQIGLHLNEHIAEPGDVVFRHACKLGLEGIVSKRLGSRYRSGHSRDWLKSKNPAAPAVKREAEEDWGGRRWRTPQRLSGNASGRRTCFAETSAARAGGTHFWARSGQPGAIGKVARPRRIGGRGRWR